MTDTLVTPVAPEEAKQPAAVNLATTTEQSSVAAPACEEINNEEDVTPVPSEAEPQAPAKLTKEEALRQLQELAEHAEEVSRTQIESLKQAFYRQHNAQIEAEKRSFIEAGGDPQAFVAQTDPTEEVFKSTLSVIKEKRNLLAAEQEKEKQLNYQIKLSIIEELKELIESPEDANTNYTEFKKLQQQWNDTKFIPQEHANELWKSYSLYVEKFYDLLKLNNEFREYDFKKNLELKTRLCEAAERLADEPDVISAFHQLQKLHQEYRDTGPVAKELRESIWARFKAASTVINRKHQQHYDNMKEAEQHNLDQKTVICEIIEAIPYDELQSFADWDNKTAEITALQAKWRTIGYAPQKLNGRIFERFRAACDEFFRRKNEYYKAAKAAMSANLEKKRLLCEKAEALKESTDWRATTETLVKLQKEWKEVGPVARKYSEGLWKRFISACDYFFEQKAKATSSQATEEQANLQKKRNIIAQLDALLTEADEAQASKAVRALIKEWNATGHVPIKEKDRLFKQYRQKVDALFDRLNLSANQKKLSNFRTSVSNLSEAGSGLHREREKLVRTLETMQSELKTYENNLGFLSTSSKKGNSLLNELNRKVEKLKADIELMKQKIKVLDEKAQDANV